ncbi:Hint domain-containing protein [Arenibacterium sp. CAU 1754]
MKLFKTAFGRPQEDRLPLAFSEEFMEEYAGELIDESRADSAWQDVRSESDKDLLASVLAQTHDPAVDENARALSTGIAPAYKCDVDWTLPGFGGKCRVTTIFGDLPIEALRRRDKVKTISGAFREVKWIDEIRLDADFMSRHSEAFPILIRAKALDGVHPVKDMLVSPGQDVWMPKMTGKSCAQTAAQLDGQPNIMKTHKPEITYYRFHCGEPEKVSVEGAWFYVAPESGR